MHQYPDKIINWRGVCDTVGFSRQTLYRLVSQGRFPAPIPLSSPARVGWSEREVQQWIIERAKQRRSYGSNAV